MFRAGQMAKSRLIGAFTAHLRGDNLRPALPLCCIQVAPFVLGEALAGFHSWLYPPRRHIGLHENVGHDGLSDTQKRCKVCSNLDETPPEGRSGLLTAQ